MNRTTIRKNTSELLKYLRKSSCLSQEKMAKEMGCSRSHYSRLETSQKDITYLQAVQISNFFSITVDAFISGFVDSDNFNNDNDAFKVPDRLLCDAYSLGKSINLHISYFKKVLGERAFHDFCQCEKIDPLYFRNLNNPINQDFLLRLMQGLIIKGKLKSKFDLEQYAHYGRSLRSHHGLLFDDYESENGMRRTFAFLNNVSKYEKNHTYKIEEIGDNYNSITFSFSPRKHVNLKMYRDDPILGSVACDWIGTYMTEFSKMNVQVNHKDCFFKGADRCVYRIQTGAQ